MSRSFLQYPLGLILSAAARWSWLRRLLLYPLRLILFVAAHWPWLANAINVVANPLSINRIINSCRHRPHPWSTVHDYISWTSLTDSHWSARHLPAVYKEGLPDPEELKGLFVRKDGQQELCAKSTCLFPAFAQYLTDGFIRTRMPNTSAGEKDDPLRKQNSSNQQIDLCTLYGRTLEQTTQLRLRSEAPGLRGKLKAQLIGDREFSPFLYEDDSITEKAEFSALDRTLGIDNIRDPAWRRTIFATGGDRVNAAPQVAMINTLFLREHNRLAGAIEQANPSWDDERVFQTARNTVIVMFIRIIVEEYINHISPAPAPVRFRLDPSAAWNATWNKPNWITTEFSLLYRWHSLIPDEIVWNGKALPAPATFMNNQLLLDAGLVNAFADLTAQPAGRLGAFNTNAHLINFEVKAIEQGRLCHLDSYASYRAYVGMAKPRAFSDISRNPAVVDFLAARYAKPADVDFYIGLFAEDTVNNSPLPSLILSMVGVDAFSQAFTNPLLSEHVYQTDTFTKIGWQAIQETNSLRDVLRNQGETVPADVPITMTRSSWQYTW
jgi:prostaglandin-endoperoxide synthase 2